MFLPTKFVNGNEPLGTHKKPSKNFQPALLDAPWRIRHLWPKSEQTGLAKDKIVLGFLLFILTLK